MSEARKILKKEDDKHLFSGKREEQEFVATRMSIDVIRRKEEETKEKIKRKKEELYLKREEQLTELKKEVFHQIQDEITGIAIYNVMINRARSLGLAENLRDLQKILDEERTHLRMLNEMKGTWITHKR